MRLLKGSDSRRLLADQWRRLSPGERAAFPLVRGLMVGLGGLEPPTSSLSGFCPRACFRRIASATCANDLPLETAGDRCEPLGSDGVWTKRGPGSGFPSRRDGTTAGLHTLIRPGAAHRITSRHRDQPRAAPGRAGCPIMVLAQSMHTRS
jgi:hypothetical protein